MKLKGKNTLQKYFICPVADLKFKLTILSLERTDDPK